MKTTILITAMLFCLCLSACAATTAHHAGDDSSYSGEDMSNMTGPSDNNVTTTR